MSLEHAHVPAVLIQKFGFNLQIKADYIVPCVMPTHFFVKPLLGAHISETVVANAIKSKLL